MKTNTIIILTILMIAPGLIMNSCKKESCTNLTWYEDYDEDTFGNPLISKLSCDQPDGYVLDNTDFNDSCAFAYPGASEICNDEIDNDGDGFIDCEDWDCDCDESNNCHDGIDNDNDGFIDCEDWDCDCDESNNCHDGIDNDNDGFIDCDDWDCDCDESNNCHDGIDNDNDGFIDCDDSDCDC